MMRQTHKAFGLAASTGTMMALHNWMPDTQASALPLGAGIILTGMALGTGVFRRRKKTSVGKVLKAAIGIWFLFAAAVILFGENPYLRIGAGALVGSVLPDMDQALGLAHRGISHAVWIPLGVLACSLRLPDGLWKAVLFGLAVGYLSHLAGDAFSKAGIAWFYPIQGYQRKGTGQFYVKGCRGPFLPLYRVGDGAYAYMPAVWYLVNALLTAGLWKVVAG